MDEIQPTDHYGMCPQHSLSNPVPSVVKMSVGGCSATEFRARSIHPGSGELDHLAPLVDLIGEALSEIAGGAGRSIAAELDYARLDALFAKACVHLLVEARDDIGRDAF